MKKIAEELPLKLFGVTIDKIEKEVNDESVSITPEICWAIDEIKKLHPNYKPIVRIVFDVDFGFDEDEFDRKKYRFTKEDFIPGALKYKEAILEIRKRALIMGEIVDSSAVYNCHFDPDPTHSYVERTKAYAETLVDAHGESLVDIWEIGNEINGEWVGWKGEDWKDPNISVEQMTAVRSRVKNELKESLKALKQIIPNAKTAMTLYFNDDDAGKVSYTNEKKFSERNGRLEEYGREYSMMKWAEDCQTIFTNVDYIFISYYQDDNFYNHQQIIPDYPRWAAIFQKLHGYYPQAKLGFGEVGPQCHYEEVTRCKPLEKDVVCRKNGIYRGCDCCLNAQSEYIKQYYVEWEKGIRLSLQPTGLENLYVGGYFYWYFSWDVVTRKNPKTITAFRDSLTGFLPIAEK